MRPWVVVKEFFNTAARTGSSYVIDRLKRSYTGSMLRLDSVEAKEKAETVLAVAHWISPVLPVLTVEWASGISMLSNVSRTTRSLAVQLALHHAAAAYAVDPIATREALQFGYFGNWRSGLDHHFSAMLHRLEPEMTPGPWGLRPEGQERASREFEASRTLWDRLRETKHRLLHRPGPNDVTISLHDRLEP